MAGEMNLLSETPLGQAIKNDDRDQFKILLKNGENPLLRDRKGNTYLHFIASMYKPNVFHCLVSTGMEVSAQNRHGNTALHVSALHKESGHVMDLMSSGVDPLLRNNRHEMAHEIPQLSKYWISLHSFFMPGIFRAIEERDKEKIDFLLSNWCRIDTKRNGLVPRQYAAYLGFHDVLPYIDRYQTSLQLVLGLLEDNRLRIGQALSKFSCNVNFMRNTLLKSHPLQLALAYQNREYILWLCKRAHLDMKSANVNSWVTIQGLFKGPLFFEALTCSKDVSFQLEMFKKFITFGSDFSFRDEYGRSIIHFALDRPDVPDCLHLLQLASNKGIQLWDRDNRGLTIRNHAELLHRTEIVRYIDYQLVTYIRDSNLSELLNLTLNGYEDFYFELNHKDTWLYAESNETNEVTRFLQWHKQASDCFKVLRELVLDRDKSMKCIDHYIMNDTPKLESYLKIRHAEMWILWRDRGGRNLLHWIILNEREDLLDYLIDKVDDIEPLIAMTDSHMRNAFHYAHRVSGKSPYFVRRMSQICVNIIPFLEARDVWHRQPRDYDQLEEELEEKQSEIDNRYDEYDECLKCLRIYKKIQWLIQNEDFTISNKEKTRQMIQLVHPTGWSIKFIQNKISRKTLPLSPKHADLGELCLESRNWTLLRALLILGLDIEKPVTIHNPPFTGSLRDCCSRVKPGINSFIDRVVLNKNQTF